MLRAAREAAEQEAARRGVDRPLLVAVTVLTSLDAAALASVGVARSLADHVDRDGVPRAVERHGRRGRLTPRSRRNPGGHGAGLPHRDAGHQAEPPAGTLAARDDQARTLDAAAALTLGSSFLVVGRPIVAAADPRQAAIDIGRDVAAAGR